MTDRKDDKDGEARQAPPARRKPYAGPRVVEYGHIAKLTRGASGTVGDGQGMQMRPCL